MYTAERPGNTALQAARMAAAARAQRERIAAREREQREWARLGYCLKHGPDCDS